ncbi:hypothetical protein [Bacteroides fragilis]
MKIKIIAGTMVALSFSLMSCSDFLTMTDARSNNSWRSTGSKVSTVLK